MRLKLVWSGLLTIVLSANVYAQASGPEWFIDASCNLYLPGSSSGKGVFPILGYNKDMDPKLLVGGFGLGTSVFKSLSTKVAIKGQANLARYAYWSETMIVRSGPDPSQILGSYSVRGADYTFGVTGTVHYFFTTNFSVGSGLGTQVLLASKAKPSLDSFTSESVSWSNKYYKPIMPVLPVELSLKFEKMLFNVRYEYALLNRYRNDLADSETEKYSLLTFEVGFRIK